MHGYALKLVRLSLLIEIALLPSLLLAANARTAVVHGVSTDIQVDGALDEAVWKEIPEIGAFTQSIPRPGDPPTEATHVWLAYNKDTLYIAVRCEDSKIKNIVARHMGRDSALAEDDNIEIVLDTYSDQRNAYYFATSPVGPLVDGRITQNNPAALEWDGIWNVRTRIDDEGWTAEFAIPFKTVGFKADRSSWGFNISRFLARVRETSRWESPSLDVKLYDMAMAGQITGLEVLSQGVGLDIKPYGILGFNRDVTRIDKVNPLHEGGADIFYRITSNLVSSTTFNPDFAEAEVDTRQVNLTRFLLFYPEKRPFFLEDAGIFEFGDKGTGGILSAAPFMPFYSRRVGFAKGIEVPIYAGEKLTGKVGRFDLGLMDAQTRASYDENDNLVVPGKNLAVGRVRANFLKQSYVGAIFTNGDPEGKVSSQLGGLDLRLATSNFLNRGKKLQLMLYAAKTSTSGIYSQDNAYGGAIYYPNDLWNVKYKWMRIDGNFNPALGFVSRKGMRETAGAITLQPRPHAWGIRQMRFETWFSDYYSLAHGATETRNFEITPFQLLFDSGNNIAYRTQWNMERLFVPWEIQPGIVIPAAKYHYTTYKIDFSSSQKKPFFVGVSYWPGSFYSGTRHSLEMAATWRKDRHLMTEVNLTQDFVNLKEGDFVSRIATFRLDYSFTPFVALANYVQYDTDSRNLGWQSRLRWILRPGNEIWVVFNHSWEKSVLDRFETAETDFRVKLSYTFRI